MRATSPAEELTASITDALERGFTVITANQRAARTLRSAFDTNNREAGLKSWETAPILHWDAWLASLWNQLLIRGEVSGVLLNPAQEHALWRTIIAADSTLPPSLRTFDSLAELAASAWRLLAQHNGLERLRQIWSTPENRSFQRWAREFDRLCKTQDLLPRGALEASLQRAFQDNQLNPQRIALVGFDELLPARKKLTAAIAVAGGGVETLNLFITPERKVLVSAPDQSDEIAAAARWARNLLIANPDHRIAVIATSLEDRRNEIDRTFREILAPELANIETTSRSAPYEFSVGRPLSHVPMVRAAVDLLSWSVAPLAIERVSALLVSPLFAMSEDERFSRAAYDAYEL
ncbi:MAG TPA: hypothetical protein VHN81_06820, partial [Edaphobacter sp.]|nr:hypothetical protein [Edaphobacter sp.]